MVSRGGAHPWTHPHKPENGQNIKNKIDLKYSFLYQIIIKKIISVCLKLMFIAIIL
jgi:hypothetical protein